MSVVIRETRIRAYLYGIGGVGLCHTPEVHLEVGRLALAKHVWDVYANPPEER